MAFRREPTTFKRRLLGGHGPAIGGDISKPGGCRTAIFHGLLPLAGTTISSSRTGSQISAMGREAITKDESAREAAMNVIASA
jgi:hypothetical protein